MLNLNQKYTAVGVMSGTSLDGVDIVLAEFKKTNSWSFKILSEETIPYTNYWKEKLSSLYRKPNINNRKADIEYGQFLGSLINDFLANTNCKVDLISSHGHTIFHEPEKGISMQIGDGEAISRTTGITTIYDFRSQDVKLGGQGAPLVPKGDLDLFPEFKYCINLGGFANLSVKKNNNIIAFDICPCNIVLNYLSRKLESDYDKDGLFASEGILINTLFEKLNAIDFYKLKPPKSLGREWVEKNILPMLENLNPKNAIRSYSEHIALQISNYLEKGDVLITGGGAYNKFLIERIKQYTSAKVNIPDSKLIEFKEALIFAFLGILRLRDEINCLASVTGANKDHSTGKIIVV